MEDVTLTFDPSTFIKGFASIDKGLNNMNANFTKFSKTSTEKLGKVKLSALALVKALAPIGLAYAGLRKLSSTVPEIGRTFGIMGNIISKNLLWPLRKSLMPILQNLLNWVTKNRTMFLKWGTVVVKVFQIITSIIKGIWEYTKSFWQTLAGHFEGIFGKTKQTITEMTDLLLFKIAVIVEFISLMLKPLGKLFGNVTGSLLKYTTNFFEGIFSGIGDVKPELRYLIDLFVELLDVMGLTSAETGVIGKSFKTLGLLLGATIGKALRLIVQSIDTIKTGFKYLAPLAKIIFSFFKGDDKKLQESLKTYQTMKEAFDKRTQERNKRESESIKRVWPEIINIFKGEDESTKSNPVKPFKKEKPKSKDVKPMSSLPEPMQINKSTTNETSNIQNSTFNNKIDIHIDGSKESFVVAENVSSNLRSLLKEEQFRAGGR